ncbi:MAG: hypothetical protein ACHQPI_13545 [Thermoanaerobaculia bacterium]
MTNRAFAPAGLAVIVLLTVGLSVLDAREDSVTADEPVHVAAGLAQAVSGGWSLNLEHPPLAKELFGRAARAAGARDGPISFRSFFRSCQDVLFRNPGGVPGERILGAARAVTIAFFALLLVASSIAAGGGRAGLFAGALVAGQAAFFPHGHLVTTDVPVAALGVAAVAATLGVAERPTAGRAGLATLTLSLAALTKFTGLLLFPVSALILLVHAASADAMRRRLAALGLAIPVAAALLTLVLLRLWTPRSAPENLTLLTGIYRLSAADRNRIAAIGTVDPGAARYATGLLVNLRQAAAGRRTYFLGKVTDRAPAIYHAVALGVTAPLSWLVLVGLGALFALRRDAAPRARLLLLAAVTVFVLSLPGPRIGVRHVLLPAALLSASAASALAGWLPGWRLGAALAAALAPLALGRSIGREGAAAALFPRPALADSSLDWGQDLLRLRAALVARGLRAEEVALAYFGGDEPAERLPGVSDLLRGGLLSGRPYLAVSRQYVLVGPEAALDPRGIGGAGEAVAAVRTGRARFLFRAGTSIDVFTLPEGPETR